MWSLSVLLVFALSCQCLVAREQGCRCLMSDSTCWPSASVWQNFNQSIDGRLVHVRPVIASCSGKAPDTNACNNVRTQWTNSFWRSDQIGAMQNYNWENTTCLEHLNEVICTQGSVPRLAVNATTVEHVQATVRLASENNLRLVIKTTGHDYLGRSTAADALLLWLHHMKNMSLLEQYTSCSGERISNAIRLTAGVQWGEVYSWLSNYNLIAIGGASSTVGAIGGFLQGGGHGPLSRWKGMGADQVLEFDVITADGQRRTVNACEDKELFWALRGGGGGSFAVVVSAVLRTYPSPSMVSHVYTVVATNQTRYSRFVRDFVRSIPTLADAGYAGYFYMADLTMTIAFFVPNRSLTEVTPVFDQLMKHNTDLEFLVNSTSSFPVFYEFFSQIMASSDSAGGNVLIGSRLIPESIVRQQPDRLADVMVQINGQSHNHSVLIGHLVAGGQVSQISVNNSINPAWRKALLQVIFGQGWVDQAYIDNRDMMGQYLRSQIEVLETVSGGEESSCYLNEADPNEPNWQQKFFGTRAHYDRLKSIKRSVDPNDLFICKNCVGSDDWSDDLNCPKISTT